MRFNKIRLLAFTLCLCCILNIFVGCTPYSEYELQDEATDSTPAEITATEKETEKQPIPEPENIKETASPLTDADETKEPPKQTEETTSQKKETAVPETKTTLFAKAPQEFNYASIPPFDGKTPYYAVNNNTPFFNSSEYITVTYEKYGKRDSLGRCTTAVANIGKSLMPTEDRGSIGMVKPTGWQTVKYDCVDGKYLYNRCHLMGFQLTGENANEDNLITGTRFMNVNGMLPFENMVADYIKETSNHVLYRITPVFVENELLARGVLMEAFSVEDNGDGICFNVFCYNAQPQIEINYANGDSKLIEPIVETQPPATEAPKTQAPVIETQPITPETKPPIVENQAPTPVIPAGQDYIANKNTKVFHYPSCRSVKQMKESNKWYFNGTADELKSYGYKSCGNCHP